MTKRWSNVPLGEVLDIFDHLRVPLNATQRAARQGPFPYYGAQSVIDHVDGYLFDGRYLLIPEDGENLNSRKLPIAYFADGRFWVNNHAHIVRGKPGVADDVFIKQWLNNADISPFVTGAAQPKLSQGSLKRMPVRLPPLAVQRRIASVLGAYDDLIEVNRRRIAVLEEMARRLFEEWFVHFRFPGCAADASPGKLPSGWSLVPLEELLVLQRGFDLPTTSRSTGPHPVVAAGGLHGTHSEFRVKSPGVVTGRSGTLGNVNLIYEDFWPLNTTLYVREFRRASPAYALHLLRHLQLGAHGGGAAVPTLNRNHVHALQVPCAPLELIESFEKLAMDALLTSDNFERQNNNLVASRDLLLPRLISGDPPITTAERDLEAVA